MLPDMEAYRELVRKIGPDQAKFLLFAINDLVAVRNKTPSNKIIDEAEKTEVFSLSFMRNSDAFFAYKNAAMLLNGLENEERGVLSESLAIKFQLAAFNNEHEFSFKFDHKAALPKRISVIIGKNGVGKSQTLGRIARSALTGTSELTDGFGDRPLINRLLAFAPTNEAESVFPSDKLKRPLIWYRRFTMNRSRRAKRDDYVSDLVLQVARSPQELAGKSRWALFEDAISAIANLSQLALTTSEPPHELISLSRLTSGSEQRLLETFSNIDLKKEPVRVASGEAFPLSSGEISFMKFAAQASLHIENGSLLLLDEPETHLHPNFISKFIKLLNNLLSATGSAAIIATHSAYFVREVFREQVNILSIDSENNVISQPPNLRTFGADVGSISYFVFGEDEPSLLASEVIDRILDNNFSWDEIYNDYKDELSLEALNTIRASLPGEVKSRISYPNLLSTIRQHLRIWQTMTTSTVTPI